MAETNDLDLTPEEQQQLFAMLNKAAPDIADKEMVPWVFANDKKNPHPFGLLNMFYNGVFTNTIGIMVAKDAVSGEEVTVLVGISKLEDGSPGIYPIAKLIGAEDIKNYLPPDGKGGYIEPSE